MSDRANTRTSSQQLRIRPYSVKLSSYLELKVDLVFMIYNCSIAWMKWNISSPLSRQTLTVFRLLHKSGKQNLPRDKHSISTSRGKNNVPCLAWNWLGSSTTWLEKSSRPSELFLFVINYHSFIDL